MSARDAFAAALAVEMRAPLARVELAASQLAREAATPSGRELASGISDAVAELDGLIARLLTLVLPAPERRVPRGDLEPVMRELWERLAPVLAARGVAFDPVAAPGEPLEGDPETVRALSVAFLRAGADLAGAGGRLALSLVGEGARYGVRLRATPAGGASLPASERHLKEIRSFAASRGGSVEAEPGVPAGSAGATVWLPRAEAEAPCAAS